MGKSSKKEKSKNTKETETAVESAPLEMSQEEFDELVEQVKGLTEDEAKEELLDGARYGEVDVVRALLDKFPTITDCVDDSGNTALHKSSANGHVTTTKLLLDRGASHLSNNAGNTPLHWAAGAGHEEIVKLILTHFKDNIDVLEKNSFGRSALTEGFSSKNTLLVKLLLEHDSATEERLLTGGKEVDDDEEGTNGNTKCASKKKKVVVHDFDFRIQPKECSHKDNEEPVQNDESNDKCEERKSRGTLRIRELPIDHADNPFGSKAIEDTTGYGIWCASLAMARWMASPEMSRRFSGKTVVELGAGCGVPGLAAAFYSDARKVYVTDLNPTTVQNLQYNIDLNKERFCGNGGGTKSVVASSIDWDDETTWPKEKIDYVIGSDLIYQTSIVPLLKKVVMGLLKPNEGRFLYVAPDDGRDGLPEFIESMKSEGCQLVKQSDAPPSFYTNPLSNRDDDDCFMHFHELQSSTYILYEFQCLSSAAVQQATRK